MPFSMRIQAHPQLTSRTIHAHPAITTRTVAYVDRRGAHAGAGTTAARSRCSQAEEDLLRMPRHPQAAR